MERLTESTVYVLALGSPNCASLARLAMAVGFFGDASIEGFESVPLRVHGNVLAVDAAMKSHTA